MLPCNHYLVKFHYHNCLPSDFKQVLPSVPPYAPTEVDGPQAFSCFPAQSKSTPPHCSNYSWSFAFWCRVYKGVIMTQLPSATRRWQCNHLSANELSCACMRLSGPCSAKSGCYPCAFEPNTNSGALHDPEGERFSPAFLPTYWDSDRSHQGSRKISQDKMPLSHLFG